MRRQVRGKKTRYRGVVDMGSGTYRVRAYWTDPATGQQRERERLVTARSADEAFKEKQKLEARLKGTDGEVSGSSERKRLGDVAEAWIEKVKAEKHEEDPEQMRLCPSTRARYETTVKKHIVPFLGDMFVHTISAEVVKSWRNHLVEHGFKRATVNGDLRVLRLVLASAGNRAGHAVKELNTKPDARITRKEPNLLTAEELDTFLEIARKDWPQHYALVLVLFTTTMRLGTALALRMEDLDPEAGEVVACRRLSQGEVIPGVKRDRFGEDVPPLLPEVYQAIMELRATFNEKQLASGLLFPAHDGRHHARTVLRKPFKAILKKADIKKRFTPHGCRRTGAKLYGRTAGTRMAMEIAGHQTEAMHHHYAPIDAAEKQAAARQVFGQLTVIAGGKGEETGDRGQQTGDRGPQDAEQETGDGFGGDGQAAGEKGDGTGDRGQQTGDRGRRDLEPGGHGVRGAGREPEGQPYRGRGEADQGPGAADRGLEAAREREGRPNPGLGTANRGLFSNRGPDRGPRRTGGGGGS